MHEGDTYLGTANVPAGGRWDPNTLIGRLYHHAYNKPSLVSFLHKFAISSQECGVSQLGLAYRWVRYHSVLRGEKGDVMIVGARDVRQLGEMLEELERGPLDEWVVERLEMMERDVPERDVDVDNWTSFRGMLKIDSGAKSQ